MADEEIPISPEDMEELEGTFSDIINAQALDELETIVASRDYVLMLPLSGVDVVNMFRALHHAEQADCPDCSDYLGAVIEALVWQAWTMALEANQ